MSKPTHVKGTADAVAGLRKLAQEIRGQHQEKAIKAALAPVRSAMSAGASRLTGTLAASFIVKTALYRNGAIAFGIVGARNYRTNTTKGLRNPSKYVHLVNNGFRNRRGRFVPGTHFMEAAIGRTAAESHRKYLESLQRSLAKSTAIAGTKAGGAK